jgi:transposase
MGISAALLDVEGRAGPQRKYPLRAVFNALRYFVKTGCHWRCLQHEFPTWPVVCQQARR